MPFVPVSIHLHENMLTTSSEFRQRQPSPWIWVTGDDGQTSVAARGGRGQLQDNTPTLSPAQTAMGCDGGGSFMRMWLYLLLSSLQNQQQHVIVIAKTGRIIIAKTSRDLCALRVTAVSPLSTSGTNLASLARTSHPNTCSSAHSNGELSRTNTGL